MRDPGKSAALRQVLPAHQNKVQPGMPRDMVVDILACVGLVVHQEATVPETEILNEDGVAGQSCRVVHDLDAP